MQENQKILELLGWVLEGSDRSLDCPKVAQELEYIAAPLERRRIKTERLEKQIEVLRKMQALEQSSSLAVSRNFARGKIHITGLTVPAGEISGDGYDVFTDSTGAVWICMADSCGKGLAPGFFSQHVLSAIRRHANSITDAYHRNPESSQKNPKSLPAIALHNAGEEIAALKTSLFCAAITIRITAKGEYSWSSAGIKPILTTKTGEQISAENHENHKNAENSNKSRNITISGWPPNSRSSISNRWNQNMPPLNFIPKRPFQVSRCAGKMESEDRIYILSDGITDRWNHHLKDLLEDCAKKTPEICPAILCGTIGNLEIPEKPKSNFEYFNEKDDMTAICIVWNK